MPAIKIYTDGACSGNQNRKNFGGWGAILIYKEHKKEIFGGEIDTTNNRMEMMALIKALEAIRAPECIVEVYSDSSYLIECFRKKWYIRWQKNGWMTTSKKPVENRDLWEALLPHLDKHHIDFFRVKGHVNPDANSTALDKLYTKFLQWNGNNFSYDDFLYITAMNNRADALANMGIDRVRV